MLITQECPLKLSAQNATKLVLGGYSTLGNDLIYLCGSHTAAYLWVSGAKCIAVWFSCILTSTSGSILASTFVCRWKDCLTQTPYTVEGTGTSSPVPGTSPSSTAPASSIDLASDELNSIHSVITVSCYLEVATNFVGVPSHFFTWLAQIAWCYCRPRQQLSQQPPSHGANGI